MLEFTADESAIAASIMANVILGISIQLQKYTKKKIIELALHGMPSVTVERMWKVALSLLVVSECTYYVSYGIDGRMSMTPLGVYTAISNAILPPLVFENHVHTLVGTTLGMIGIIMLIFVPPQDSKPLIFVWDSTTKGYLTFFLVLCITLCLIRTYRPANCSLKLTANCGISGLLGAFSVALIKLLFYTSVSKDGVCDTGMESICGNPHLIWPLILVIFVLQLVLLSDTLEFFPVWQVVPHHYMHFSIFMFMGSAKLFHEYDNASGSAMYCAFGGYCLCLVGVWVAAKPHLDIPASISHSKLLPQLESIYYERFGNSSSSSNSPEMLNLPSTHSEVELGHFNRGTTTENEMITKLREHEQMCCMREIYCSLMNEILKNNQGFSFISINKP